MCSKWQSSPLLSLHYGSWRFGGGDLLGFSSAGWRCCNVAAYVAMRCAVLNKNIANVLPIGRLCYKFALKQRYYTDRL